MTTDKICIIAIDPGSEKCGMAVLGQDKEIFEQRIVPTEKLIDILKSLIFKYRITAIAIGSGTTGKYTRGSVQHTFPATKIVTVNEYRTTDEARKRYWKKNPPKGWKRLVPQGMLVPPQPVDDLAAVIIGEKYLDELQTKDENKSDKID